MAWIKQTYMSSNLSVSNSKICTMLQWGHIAQLLLPETCLMLEYMLRTNPICQFFPNLCELWAVLNFWYRITQDTDKLTQRELLEQRFWYFKNLPSICGWNAHNTHICLRLTQECRIDWTVKGFPTKSRQLTKKFYPKIFFYSTAKHSEMGKNQTRAVPKRCRKTIVHAWVTFRLDYCTFLLLGCPNKSSKSLQLIQDVAAHVNTRT